ncbi:hypothetical protein DXT97_02570 [Agrobacterium tumefaciens]|uniref:hypothetical protein n=1 Tax=Agrobacterium tumefaciens TaxID=358 RepID=UPI001296A313|nr:hypothetical protein [Agrobacterium tumefaciens]MQB35703.1 hypothetical protein [Agrobacterium tumefaciens]
MNQYHFSLARETQAKKLEERRRRKRRQREDEYRRRIERLRRQIDEARRRRQRLMLLLLLAVLAMQESFLAAFQRSFTYQPDDPDPENWTPDPLNDYAPQPGRDDHIDGYNREQWRRITVERGIKLSRKAELKAQWEADPEREHFPTRYQEWGYKPFLTEIMNDLTDQRYQPDALEGLKLLSPPETHKYLNEVYALNPLNLLYCRAELSADIVRNFQSRSVLWEEQKKRLAEEAQKAKKDPKPDDDEKKFEP